MAPVSAVSGDKQPSSEANSTKKGDAAAVRSLSQSPTLSSTSNPPLAPLSAVSGDKPSSSPKIDPLTRAIEIVKQEVSSNPTLSSNKPIIVDAGKVFEQSYLNGEKEQDRLSAKLAGLRRRIPGSSPN